MVKKPLIVRDDSGQTTVEFYAAVYNQKSKPIVERGKEFREVIRAGAFEPADLTNVKATVFHDREKIIGRSSAGTLELISSEYGLKAIVRMGNTTLHKDTVEQIERGDLFESSFIARLDKYSEVMENGELIRYIDTFSVVRDVSIVDDGAYSNTNIIIRELPEDNEDKKKPEDKPKDEKKEPEKKADDNEEVKRNQNINNKQMDYIEEIKRAAAGGEKATIEIKRDASSNGAVTGLGTAVPQGVAKLDIMGAAPIWRQMGVDYLPNCQGTFVLPFAEALTASELEELAAVTPVDLELEGNVVSPKRFPVQRKFTAEALATASPENIDALLNDMYKAVDRQLTGKIFSVAESGATAVSTVTAVDEDAFDSLSGEIDTENEIGFLMSRSLFYANKNTKLDAGSGLHVMQKDGQFGKTWEGDNIYFSSLFKPTNPIMIAGDMKRVLVSDYNKTEVIVDPYTEAAKGQVIITVVGLYNVALRNPKAFRKSATIA